MLENDAAGDRRGGQAYRPLPVLPRLHDHLPVGRALHAPRRSCARAHRGDLPAAAPRSPGCAPCLARVLPDNRRLRRALRLGALAQAVRPVAGLHRAQAAGRDAASGAGAAAARADRRRAAACSRPEGARKGRVALMAGCVTPGDRAVDPEAAISVLTRHGIEVVLPEGQGCCGGARPPPGPRAARRTTPPAATSTPGPAELRRRASTPSWSPHRAAAPRSRTTVSCCAPIRPMRTRPRACPALADGHL